MDLWVVAAATGAGYVAKYWQNLSSREKETSTESFSFDSILGQSESRNLLQQLQDQTSPLHRLNGKQLDTDGFSINGEDFFTSASSSNSQRQEENYNLFSLTSFPPVLCENENFEGIEGKSTFSDISRHLKSRHYGNFLEPLDSSLGNSLISQLHREYASMEEFVGGSLPSSAIPTVRSLLLADGSLIINRASHDFKGRMQLEKNRENEMQRKLKKDTRKRSRRFSTMRESVQPLYSQGFSNAKLIFFLGITTGIMSIILTNKRDVENINRMLKETENTVRDLHKELEMKDLLNVKAVPVPVPVPDEGFKSRGTTNEYPILSGTPNAESSEAMSKIEAELEAELEMLELNMRISSLERISDLVELDPDCVADIVQGDLNLNEANREPGGLSDPSENDISGTSTDHHPDTTNYGVSPKELSMRLHEVIQSRLEARIMELETALENSQKRLHSMELESKIPWQDFHSELESSSQESIIFIDEGYDNYESSL